MKLRKFSFLYSIIRTVAAAMQFKSCLLQKMIWQRSHFFPLHRLIITSPPPYNGKLEVGKSYSWVLKCLTLSSCKIYRVSSLHTISLRTLFYFQPNCATLRNFYMSNIIFSEGSKYENKCIN